MDNIKTELLTYLDKNDLLRASLVVGKIQDPAFDLDAHVDKVLAIAAKIWHRSSRTRYNPVSGIEKVAAMLFGDFGLEGKTEKFKHLIDDPDRFYLHRVMEKKVGSPLAVTILFAVLCEQIGIECEYIALPSHYMLKLKSGDEDVYIDAFDRGRLLGPEEFQRKLRTAMHRVRGGTVAATVQTNLFEKLTAAQLVARCVQQLKHIYILKGNALEALRCVELLTAIFPGSPELARDRGILYCEMEYFSKAMEDLKRYLKQRPQAEDVGEIKKLTAMLRGYREIIN